MDKKSIILYFSAIAFMILIAGVMLFFLYSDNSGAEKIGITEKNAISATDSTSAGKSGIKSSDSRGVESSDGSALINGTSGPNSNSGSTGPKSAGQSESGKPDSDSVPESAGSKSSQGTAATQDGKTAATAMSISRGPFTVKNSATGKNNILTQNKDNSLTFSSLDGIRLWTVPFGSELCGYVAEIDYYANGKLQYLFASGDKLYLIDRLGRTVKPFPSKLPKEVLAGPVVYDFTGAKGYSAMILHTDNSVGLYNLKGKPADGWKGMTLKDKLTEMPVLIGKSRKYWVVKTTEKDIIYGFDGGTPLITLSGRERIADGKSFELTDANSLTYEMKDGRKKTIKLN